MTFNANVPDASQSPNIFPAQNSTNMTRLKQIISNDHKFNNTVQVPDTDGYHKKVSLINQTSSPSIPAGANAMMYSLSVQLQTGTSRVEVFSRNSEGPSLMGARAYVMFDGTSSDGACTINSAHNVSNVDRITSGSSHVYRITFTSPLKTAKYATFVTGQPPSASGSSTRIGSLGFGAAYTNAQTTSTVIVQFQNSTGEIKDPSSGAVFVFGG